MSFQTNLHVWSRFSLSIARYEEIGLLTDAEMVWREALEVSIFDASLEPPVIYHEGAHVENNRPANTYRQVQCAPTREDPTMGEPPSSEPPHVTSNPDIEKPSSEALLQEIRNRRKPQNRMKRNGRWYCPGPDGCNLTFSRKSDAVRHFYTIHAAGAFTCPCCRRSFTRSDALRRHARSKNSCRLHRRSRKAQAIL